MKVIVSTHGRFHAFELAQGLNSRGALHQLVTPYPSWAVKKITNADLPLRSVGWIELLKRFCSKARLGNKPDAFVGRKFGEFAARTDMTGADIFCWLEQRNSRGSPRSARGRVKNRHRAGLQPYRTSN